MLKKRALYIGFKRKYANRYLEVVIEVLENCFDLTLYGPGYSLEKELRCPIENWIEDQNKFDFIFIDPYIPIFEKKISRSDFNKSHSMNILYYSYDDYYNLIPSYKEYFKTVKVKKAIIAIYDYHALKKSIADYIIESNSYVIDAFGFNLNRKISETKKIYGESSYFRNSIDDFWYDFEIKYKKLIISFPHAIFNEEFFNTSIEKRKYKFNVVGVLYPERKNARKLLNIKLKLHSIKNQISSYFKIKFGIRQMTEQRLAKYFQFYNSAICNSKMVYCSGSPLLYPVRKYFEIPAKGSVAIGLACNGFEHLGFINEENFIIVENNNELLKVLNTYSDDHLQYIANNGNKLIREKHSLVARIEQMDKTFKLIFSGKFKGSYWKDGEYKFF